MASTDNVIQFKPDSGANRLPPHNIDAEYSVLGGIMIDPEAFSVVETILRPEMFYIPAHATIYRAMTRLRGAGHPPDLRFVAETLSNFGLLQQVGGKSKLADIVESTVSAVNIDHLAHLVRDKWVRRQLIASGNEIANLGYETQTSLAEVMEEAERKLYAIATDNTHAEFGAKAPEEALIRIFQRLEAGGEPPVLKTGLYDLDAMIGGLRRGDLDIVAGRASMGKTVLGAYLAYQVAVVQQLPVVFFSAEMSTEQLLCRFLALDAGIDSARLLNNKILDSEWSHLSQSIGKLSSCPLRIDEHPRPTISHMRTQVQRVKAEEGGQLGLVVLDYLQLLGNGDSRINRVTELDNITKECKAIAKEFDVPFLALAQINRSVEARSNKRPMISELRESGAIEQTADLILLLYRDDYYNPDSPDRGTIEVIVGKNRSGGTGTAKFLFEPALSRFLNLAKK